MADETQDDLAEAQGGFLASKRVRVALAAIVVALVAQVAAKAGVVLDQAMANNVALLVGALIASLAVHHGVKTVSAKPEQK